MGFEKVVKDGVSMDVERVLDEVAKDILEVVADGVPWK